MSATLDSELFCSFFGGAPFLSIPGRTFPVNQYYLEDALDATGYVVEEDSRYALRSRRGGNTTSMWVTGKGGEKKRQVVSLESELESLEVSDRYEGYSMSTRR
jgi:ATP-dependent RNA helicase DHX29